MLRLVLIVCVFALSRASLGEDLLMRHTGNYNSLTIHAGTVMCASGCMDVNHRYDVPTKIVPKDQNCDGASFDKNSMQRREVRKGIRYTGEYMHWRGCETEEDSSCPSEYEYFAFMAYGCEKKNGTRYWTTHTYEAIHNMLVEFKK